MCLNLLVLLMSILTTGAAGECTTITVWGSLGRKRSRGIQLGFATFHLLHNMAFLLWILYYCDHLDLEALVTWYLPLEDGLVWLRPGLHQQVHLDLLDLYTSYSSVVISAGLVSYACMMYQIFYFY